MAKEYILLGTENFKTEVVLVSGLSMVSISYFLNAEHPAKYAPKSRYSMKQLAKGLLSSVIFDVLHTPLGVGVVKIGLKVSML